MKVSQEPHAIYNPSSRLTRRKLFESIGKAGGSAVMLQAMTSLGHAAQSAYSGPIKLEGAPKGASVLVLGAGLAGLVAALELRNAGYHVTILEYLDRSGGRNWSLRGGDVYTELGGARQVCGFGEGLYFNPGPWRIPYHHHALIDYCKRLHVQLEPFVELNMNAYLHSTKAFDGKPKRLRHIWSDYHGYVSELLAKAVGENQLDDEVTQEDKEILLESLRAWGALDKNFKYASAHASAMRGYDRDGGGGPDGAPVESTPLARDDVLRSNLWRLLALPLSYEYGQTMFQPVGGMDMISKALTREVSGLIEYDCKVVRIRQSEAEVVVDVNDAKGSKPARQFKADWCVCTIPVSILGQIDTNFSPRLSNAISAISYAPSVKVGVQFKRRFWEEDEAIYGGNSFSDLPNGQISYPSMGFLSSGPAVALGAYCFRVDALEYTSLDPKERIARTLDYMTAIHPQAKTEFDNGVAIAWHRMPATLGCFGMWKTDTRRQFYRDLCEIDGRTVLAGEHCSYVNAWQEGAILSSLDAIQRLHQRNCAISKSDTRK
jgi:monoamine oxidase